MNTTIAAQPSVAPGKDDNALSGAEAMVRMLQAYGVQHMFGLCGDTTLPFYDALSVSTTASVIS